MKVKLDFLPLSFKLTKMEECTASLRNQCPHDWLKTQAKTTKEKQSTIVWEICHVKGGGIWPMTFTTICLL